MKPGSIVKCTHEGYVVCYGLIKQYYPNGVPNTKDNYTVRAIDGDGIYLEEIVNPPHTDCIGCAEPNFQAKNFRELLPPEAMQQEIKELLEEPAPCD